MFGNVTVMIYWVSFDNMESKNKILLHFEVYNHN